MIDAMKLRRTADGVALVWFRRDLRDYDNAALRAALEAHRAVHCAFVFDTEILDRLEAHNDRRVTFIWESVRELRASLEARGGGLRVVHGRACDEIPRLAKEIGAVAVYANRDYEPEAIARDDAVAATLREAGIDWRDRKDQVVFELGDVRTRAGGAFSVYTPYRRAWLARLRPSDLAAHDVDAFASRLVADTATAMPSLQAIGFERTALPAAPGMSGASRTWAAFRKRLAGYAERRDHPALDATSQLSVHLRFGTVSIRELVRHAWSRRTVGAQAWLSQLVWREFFFAVLAARPDVVAAAYRRSYDALAWNDDEAMFDSWCAGHTGYPLVDAAMRELAAQGTMHNRLRMVSASFLVKHLGIDWRRGERHFARSLLDYDLAANNGGWQWCASTGCDAQPWFRIFSPEAQSRRFDSEGAYIRRWLPELAGVPAALIHAPWRMTGTQQRAARCTIGRDYPPPIVDHAEARRAALARYSAVASR